MSNNILAKAAWRVTLDGQDLTAKMAPRLISLSLTEKRGDEADLLEIVLDDRDGLLEMPPSGKKLTVELGWERGSAVSVGLVNKGTFKVDEARFRGPPDQICIRARAADFTDTFRTRRERSFTNATVSTIIDAIAATNGLTPHVDAALGAKTLKALGSGLKSDAARLKALGKQFDAVATVKAGKLIFAPIGAGKTVSGTEIPTETINRSQLGRAGAIDYGRSDRDSYDGVEATWHDKRTGKRETVVVGGAGEKSPKKLRKIYASEASARTAAEAEAKRVQRGKATASIEMAYGRPDITPERPISLTGFKSEINAQTWLVEEATHTMDGRGGLSTRLQLEST